MGKLIWDFYFGMEEVIFIYYVKNVLIDFKITCRETVLPLKAYVAHKKQCGPILNCRQWDMYTVI